LHPVGAWNKRNIAALPIDPSVSILLDAPTARHVE